MTYEDEEDEADEDDNGEAEDIHYKDFFDPAEQAAAPVALQVASGNLSPGIRMQPRASL